MWPLQQEKGRVTGAIIDLVSLSGHCVLDPLPDRMTVFGFVLARDEHDQHGALLFSDRISVRNRPPLDFIYLFIFFADGDIHRKGGFGASSSAARLWGSRSGSRGVETKHNWALRFSLW